MEITVAGQTWMFLMSLVLGSALGVCYDVFRILRIAFRNPPAVILAEDIFFSIVCAVASFLYMVSVDRGQLRVFVLIGEVVGFALYYCTVGVLVIGISKKIIAAVRWVFGWLWRLFAMPVLRFVRYLQAILTKLCRRLAIYLKNKAQISNIHLKKHSDLLYNLKKRLHGGRRNKNAEGQDNRKK